MPTISLELQEFYRQQVANLSNQAKNYSQKLLLAEALEAGDWVALEQLILEILQEINDSFLPVSQEIAGLYLDVVASVAGVSPRQPVQATPDRSETLENWAREIVTRQQNQTPELTVQTLEEAAQKLGEQAKYMTDRESFETLVREIDSRQQRFARVPSGRETCGFCTMLASRGFVYRSAEKASSYHRYCDCVLVPGYPGIEVDGYDPDGLYQQYEQAQKTVNSLDLRESWAKMTPAQQARYSNSYRRYRTQQLYRVLAGKPAITY